MEPVVIALDFETADNGADSACALGMARVRGGEVEDVFYRLIRPPRRRIWYTHIHGITWNMVRDCPGFAELWPECAAFLRGADYLAAHNAPFDRRILLGCCAAAGVDAPAAPFLCTVRGARKGLRLPRNRLSDVCAHLGIALDHHNAASDALAAARIYVYLRAHGLPLEAMRIE
ncbi:MAG: exonuclease [Desulfovibrionaceae bacterium]|nr:exonuclease [Desulfovibrionaceae bacterium]